MELTKKASETYRDLDLIIILNQKGSDRLSEEMKKCDDYKEYLDLQEEYDMRVKFCELVKRIREMVDEVLEASQKSEVE